MTGFSMKRGDKFTVCWLPNECIVTCVRKGTVYFKHGNDCYQTPLEVMLRTVAEVEEIS